MAQHKASGAPTTVLEPAATPNRTTDDRSIFSAPAREVVSQWWAESKRRWAELNGPDALVAPVVIRRQIR